MSNQNIAMIQEVAAGLKGLAKDVVFVGGATVSLYLPHEFADEVRPTDDVDVIMEISSKANYSKVSEKLLSLRFTPDASIGAPICRWKYLGITIDIMPLDEKILGFSNRFYREGFKRRDRITLPSGQVIYILPVAYFLACKLEAFFNRGVIDPRFSRDLEDIVTILSEYTSFESVSGEQMIISYLKDSFERIFNDPHIEEAIRGFLTGTVIGTFEVVRKRAMSF